MNLNGLYREPTTSKRPIYGSSRLGIMNKAVKSPKSAVCSLPSFYLFLTDYYPFGYPISFRTHSTGYRYGFNGQEGDNEIYGDNLNYAFQYRMYDARIGRFWSVDPLRSDYPWNSTYAFAENKPIKYIELEGKETGDRILDEDPLIGYKITAGIINDAVDGFGNLMLIGMEFGMPDKVEGKLIRKYLKTQGFNVPKFISDKELGNDFKLRKENRDLVVKSEEGFINDVLEIGISLVDVCAVLYPANGSAFLFKEGGITLKAVQNMGEFFIKSKFGQEILNISNRTNYFFKEQKIFKIIKKDSKLGLDKGDYYYLDDLHKDHIEVFDSNRNFKKALNLDGTINKEKTAIGLKEKRKIKL